MSRAALLLAALLVVGCGSSRTTAHTTPSRAAKRPPQQAANGPSPARPGHVAPSRRAVPVLMYHVIAAPKPGAAYAGLWVAPKAFREQVDALARAGFTAVTLDTVLDAWRGRAMLPRRPVVFSFDDGYLSQGKEAAAVLRERRWPGVLNLAWHNLGAPGGLTAGRVRTMIAEGWEIDAHSLTHPDLRTLDATALRREVAGSRERIRRAFGVPADAFCYPAGRYDPTVEAAVRAAGYRAATTVEPGAARPGADHFALPRVRVNGGDGAGAVLGRVRAALDSAA